MSEEDRLSLLRSLDPAQYQNIMKVVCAMPNISMEVRVEGEIEITNEQIRE